MKTIAFFNNKGGVGKTTLVYHVAWMYAELGQSVLAVDLDPQANLTTMFLNDESQLKLWPEDGENQSILTCIQPIIDGLGDIADAVLQRISPQIHLLPGDLGLSQYEDKLSDSVLRGTFQPGDTAVVDLEEGEIVVHPAVAEALVGNDKP